MINKDKETSIMREREAQEKKYKETVMGEEERKLTQGCFVILEIQK